MSKDKNIVVSEECVYNPVRDIMPVEQFGYVDLAKANETSSVPAVDGLDDDRYNGIDDPNSIGARPRDVFEQMQANKQIVGYKAPAVGDGSEKSE